MRLLFVSVLSCTERKEGREGEVGSKEEGERERKEGGRKGNGGSERGRKKWRDQGKERKARAG